MMQVKKIMGKQDTYTAYLQINEDNNTYGKL